MTLHANRRVPYPTVERVIGDKGEFLAGQSKQQHDHNQNEDDEADDAFHSYIVSQARFSVTAQEELVFTKLLPYTWTVNGYKTEGGVAA